MSGGNGAVRRVRRVRIVRTGRMRRRTKRRRARGIVVEEGEVGGDGVVRRRLERGDGGREWVGVLP